MLIRFKVPYDNGTSFAANEITGAIPDRLAKRLVQSGLAEEAAIGDMDRPEASMAMTKPDLVAMAKARQVQIETDDNKTEIVRKINGAG